VWTGCFVSVEYTFSHLAWLLVHSRCDAVLTEIKSTRSIQEPWYNSGPKKTKIFEYFGFPQALEQLVQVRCCGFTLLFGSKMAAD